MAQLSKRTRWRPVVDGYVVRGGAGGFHHSRTGRVTNLTARAAKRQPIRLVETPEQELALGFVQRALDRFRRRNVRKAA